MLREANRWNIISHTHLRGFPGGSDGKESACNVGGLVSTPRSGRCSGEGPGNPLQYLTWRNPWTEDPGRLQPMGSQRVGSS